MSAEHVITPDDKCPCGKPQQGSGYCSYDCYSKHDAYAARVEPPELAAIRERTEADFVTDPGSVSGDLAKELMQARLDRRALLTNFDAELEAHSTLDPEMPRLAAQPGAGDAETSGTGSDRGTGVPEAQNSRQAVEGLSSRHWLKWDTIARTITGCQCGFRADESSDCGFGDSVVAHLLEVGAADSRPGHYREAANSLRGYAAGRHVGDTYDSGFTDGITAAADRIDSYARDLADESRSMTERTTT